MAILPISHQSPASSVSSLGFHMKWTDFEFITGHSKTTIAGTIESNQLKGTSLSCPTDTEAGQWKNRRVFIETVLSDVISKCPKDEPLIVTSLGSDRLLIEYILGKTLIEKGFSNIYFFLVDPVYLFSDQENREAVNRVLEDFHKNISSIYHSVYGNSLANERIRYLSRAQNISKYFISNANVIVIESLPPDAELMKNLKKYKIADKKPIDLMVSGYIVPPTNANTVALIPAAYVKQLKQSGATLKDRLPLAIFQRHQVYFYLDWGCKIEASGEYHLAFSGEEHYLPSLGISQSQNMKLPSGEVIQTGQWIPKMRQSIEQMLGKEMTVIKEENTQSQLTQGDISSLLVKVQKIATQYMETIECFFLADYILDRNEALAFIASHAGQHYRKLFTLGADAETTYKIDVKEI